MNQDINEELRRFIRERLKHLGLSESNVSLQLGKYRGYIHDFVSGKQKQLPLEERHKLLGILQALPSQLNLGPSSADSAPGFGEWEMPEYLPGDGDLVEYHPFDGDPFSGLAGADRRLWLVQTNACDNLDIRRGNVIVVDASKAAINALRPLQPVHVTYRAPSAPDRSANLLRQFVPPHLLITNSSKYNSPSLDTDRDDAQIRGVIVSAHMSLRGLA